MERSKGFIPFRGHLTLYEFQAILHPELFRKLFKFAIVRNPWDRVVSQYFFHTTSKKFKARRREEWEKYSVMSFTQYVESVVASIPTPGWVLQLPWISLGTRRCFGYLSASLGVKCLSDALPYLEQFDEYSSVDVDHVCRFEDLPKGGMEELSEKSGCPLLEMPYWNSTTHSHYSEYYTSHTREIVRKACEEDIDTFKYAFSD